MHCYVQIRENQLLFFSQSRRKDTQTVYNTSTCVEYSTKTASCYSRTSRHAYNPSLYTAVSVPENVSGIKTKGNMVVSVAVASTSECVHVYIARMKKDTPTSRNAFNQQLKC